MTLEIELRWIVVNKMDLDDETIQETFSWDQFEELDQCRRVQSNVE